MDLLLIEHRIIRSSCALALKQIYITNYHLSYTIHNTDRKNLRCVYLSRSSSSFSWKWCVDSFYLYCVQYMTSGSYKFLFQRKIFCSLGQLVVLILSICIVYSI